jgi:UDPglucose 6-dehydrogenase
MNKRAKIVVVGIGYVGLSNAVLLARDNSVIATDLSKERVDLVNSGKSPIVDAELEDFLANKNLDLSARLDATSAIEEADFVIVATPTNYDPETGYFDTSSVESVIELSLELNPNITVVVKSTIPVGFIQRIQNKLSTKRVFFSPEFLREGRALYDNLHPSRIIVGDNGPAAHWFSDLLVAAAISKDVPVLFTDPAEAEAIKLFSNTYLAMRVSYLNELDSYALANGMNSKQMIEGVSLDPRIGNHYNNPSFGYGGYCLPKDTKQLLANFSGVPQNMISAIVQSNDTRMEFLTEKILAKVPQTVGVYQLAMKAGSDNWRHSAIQGVMTRLAARGVRIVVYEPAFTDDVFLGHQVHTNIATFKEISDLILTNRLNDELDDVDFKVFTRDIFGTD